MGRIAEVVSIDGDDVKVDPEDPSTPEHYGPAGFDSRPLKGDFAAISDDAEGSAGGEIAGYHDAHGNRVAKQGEARMYSRSPSGAAVAEVHAKDDGSVVIKSMVAPLGGSFEMKPDGSFMINGVEITADGEVIAKGVRLSTHVHPTAMGPSGPPTPG